jgi:hypothetical protein
MTFLIIASEVVAGSFRERFFSTAGAQRQHKSSLAFHYQWLCAVEQELEWRAEESDGAYRRFINQDGPFTEPGRGVGLHAMTAGFFQRNDDWVPAFAVQPGPWAHGQRLFVFADAPFSIVWREAINWWADQHTIFDEDRDRIAAAPPAPALFADLRHRMNQEGHRIPPDALGPVFAEQRRQLADSRGNHRVFEDSLQSAIADWDRRPASRIDGTRFL